MALPYLAPPASLAQAFGIEASAAVPLTRPQAQDFGWGGSISGMVVMPLSEVISGGARLQGLWLSDRDRELGRNRRQPGIGSAMALYALARLHPWGGADLGRRFFVEFGAGAGVTGKLLRFTWQGAIGYGFPLGQEVGVAPLVRYSQVVQGTDPLEERDARIALFGVELMWGSRFVTEPGGVPQVMVEAPLDSDADGVPDDRDACVDSPEDVDGFQDADGCPDLDDDQDGVPDSADACVQLPEDLDGFEDEDGCPDEDNDQDGLVDAQDSCPQEPETVNGNLDEDGCPDEGLIEFKRDRVVLEEQVLFEVDRSRVRSAARPVLSAVVRLQRQHPEWLRVRIEGHADVRGEEGRNLQLSERRAQRVRAALVKLGMDPELVVAQGFGSSRVRDTGKSAEAHRRNRRVEFVVISTRPVRSEPPSAGAPASATRGGSTAGEVKP